MLWRSMKYQWREFKWMRRLVITALSTGQTTAQAAVSIVGLVTATTNYCKQRVAKPKFLS